MTEDRSALHAGERVVIAYTTGDDQHPAVRLHAIRHAREDGCAVILYDAEAASTFSDPTPNQWDHGARALAEYAIEQGAHLVFVPAGLEAMDELEEPGIPIERVGSEVPNR